MTLQEIVAAGKYLEAGQILFNEAPSKSGLSAAVLESCIKITGIEQDVFRDVLAAESMRVTFANVRKLTRELENAASLTPRQEVLRCLCYVAENVAKVRANELESEEFDEDSGHWLLKNVIDVLTRLGSKDATSEAIAILEVARGRNGKDRL